MKPAPVHLIEVDDLPEYPLQDAGALKAHYFTMFWHDRWLGSELRMTASLEVRACALDLFFVAQRQTPIGTLPDNDAILAKLLLIDLAQWQDLRSRSISPLHNWEPCKCGTAVRLMHPVVLEVLMDAFDRREAREVKQTDRAVYARLGRLKKAMADLGCSDRVIADAVLVERLDAWLLEHCRGNRMMRDYERALTFAKREGWFTELAARR